jgi:hypothetical protein
VIVDHSRYCASNGYFPTTFNLDRIEAKFKDLVVEIVSEKEFDTAEIQSDEDSGIAVVLRLFIYEDIEGKLDSLAKIYKQSDLFINSFASEILTSKKWFSEFWKPENLNTLKDAEKAVIKKYIPFTSEINEQNEEYFLKIKDGFVFKEVQSNSGKGVFIGMEHSSAELSEKLLVQGHSNFVVQELVKHEPVKIPDGERGKYTNYNTVLGLHFSADKYSGMLVRAGINSGVINVGSGAGGSSWAIVIPQHDADQILLGT